MRPLRTAAAALLALTLLPSPATATVDAEGIAHVAHVAYEGPNGFFDGGTDLDFHGHRIYAPQQNDGDEAERREFGGVHVFSTDPDDLVTEEEQATGIALLGTVPCPGYQIDVAVLDATTIAIAFHEARCMGFLGSGVALVDVADPADPQLLGRAYGLPGGTHTLTVHPSKPFIYASPGGLANGGGTQQIIDVSDPAAPRVLPGFLPNAAGCHDFEFVLREDGDYGVCVGLTESQIWDVSDPAQPEILSHIVNPAIQFHHSGIVTDDGQFLVIGDEAFGAHDCAGGPTGAMFSYDISDPLLPVPLGWFGLDRSHADTPVSTARDTWCTAHLYNFVPGTHTMVASWYSGGLNVIDWSDMAAPREVAHYRTDGEYAAGEVTNYWSAYWHEGRVYANDRRRGLDVYEVTALAPDGSGAEAAASTGGGWAAGRLTARGAAGLPAPQPVAVADTLWMCRIAPAGVPGAPRPGLPGAQPAAAVVRAQR